MGIVLHYVHIILKEEYLIISTFELLQYLHKCLFVEYLLYRAGAISQKEYCKRVKPIDEAIDKLETATLQGSLVLKESSLLLSAMPEN